MPSTNAFGLPTLDNGSTPAGDPPPVIDSNGQSITSYVTPTDAVKTVELAQKVSSQGTSTNFENLTNKVELTQADGQVIATATGSNTPLGVLATVPTQQTPADSLSQGNGDNTLAYKVTVSANSAFGTDSITFDVMPEIGESHGANYREFNPIQHPGSILKYEGTGSREWTVNTKLISRTSAEASANLKIINLIRSWVMPFYGQGTADDATTAQFLGAPPPVLTFSAYGASMIGPLKCVLTTYNWNWPNDIDYIKTDDAVPVPFPVIVTLSLNLKEAWSPKEFSAFNLDLYRSGSLPAAFGGAPYRPQQSQSGISTPSGLNASVIDTSQTTTITDNPGGTTTTFGVA